jgi:hypothetical protein
VLAVDLGATLPLLARPPDADRIADRLAVAEDEIELALGRCVAGTPQGGRNAYRGVLRRPGMLKKNRYLQTSLQQADRSHARTASRTG